MANASLSFGATVLAVLLLPALGAKAANSSPNGARVLVIYNSNWTADADADGVQDSLQVANYYMAKRAVPSANVLGLACSTGSSTQYSSYLNFYNEVVAPIKARLATLGAANIDILLCCYGVPYVLPGGPSLDNADRTS